MKATDLAGMANPWSGGVSSGREDRNPHYVSSFSFYLGDENLAYYRTRRLAFFAGPVLILIGVMALRLTKLDAAVQSSLYVWNVFHVSMQSAGILALYRRLHGGSLSEC